MRKLIALAVAFTLVTPSFAFAEPAAKALSLGNAAVQPVRASAQTGKKLKAVGEGTPVVIVAGVLISLGIACALWCGGSDSP